MKTFKMIVITALILLLLPAYSFAGSIDDPDSVWYAGEPVAVEQEAEEIPYNFSFSCGEQTLQYSISKVDQATYTAYQSFQYLIKVKISKADSSNSIWWDIDNLIKGYSFEGSDPIAYIKAEPASVLLKISGNSGKVAGLGINNDKISYASNICKSFLKNHTTEFTEEELYSFITDFDNPELPFDPAFFSEKICYKLDQPVSGIENGFGFKFDNGTINKGWFTGIIYFTYIEDEVVAAIDALPAADAITLENKDAVEAARAQYDALSEEGKQEITNYAKLQLAEATIAKLEAEKELAETKTQLSSVSSQLASALTDNATAQDTIKDLQDKVEKAEADLKTAEDNLDAANKALEEAKAASGTKEKEMQDQIDKANSDLQAAQSNLDDANAALTEAQETIKIQKKAIKGIKAKGQKKKATVTWKSADKGFKYEVYSSTKISSKFKKAATVKKNKAVIKKLKSKKTYYIKVRAFKTIDGKKVYTQYSDTVSVKAK